MFCTFFSAAASLEWIPRSILRPGKSWPFASAPAPPRRVETTAATAPPSPPPCPPPEDWPARADSFATTRLAFPIDPKQTEILGGTPEHQRRVIVNCTRQWGKSTTAAIKALHHALHKPGSLTLIASRTRHQAAELLEKVAHFTRSLALSTRRVPGHAASLMLPNRSRIIAIPGRPASVRGYSAVSLLIIDEAAFVPDSLYEALRPMLATTNGDIWLLSTPNGQKGFFYREWIDQAQTWSKFAVSADSCPRISPEFLAEERRKHGPAVFEREYLCKFTSSSDTYFDINALEASAVPSDYSDKLGFSFNPTRYYVGFDLGQKQSHSAIVVLEKADVTSKDRDPVTFAWIKRTEIHLRRAERLPLNLSYIAIADRLLSAIKMLPNSKDATLVLDATGCGGPFLDLLRKQPIGAHLMSVIITGSGLPSQQGGMHRISKQDLMKSLNYLISSPDFKINAPADQHQDVMSEMQNIRMLNSANGVTRFTTSGRDDLVMAFALASWPARKFLQVR